MLRILALLAALAASPAFAGTIYVDTGGSATNSGSTDQNTANLSGATSTDVSTVITLSGSPDLSGVVTSGANQSSIYLTNSTVANRKIYWITAKDDGLDTVTVNTAPSCTAGACGAWAIGGRFVWTPASIEAALRAGDTVIINNSPASTSADWLTARTAGDTTSGYIKVVGKTGVRPVINVTNTNQIFEGGNQAQWWFENLEFDQDGASGPCVQSYGAYFTLYNVKISDCGAEGVSNTFSATQLNIFNSEITGTGADAISPSGDDVGHIVGNYIHDVVGDCIQMQSNRQVTLINNVFDTCGARAIYYTGSTSGNDPSLIMGNTIYGSGNSGLEVEDSDTSIRLINNIFSENGNAAGEYNVEWVSGSIEVNGNHAYNAFYSSGGGGSGNVSGLTVNSTEITTDPLLTNPASGDFTLQATSPAISIGYPGQLLGTTGQGYLDLGPQQRQPSSGGAHVVGG